MFGKKKKSNTENNENTVSVKKSSNGQTKKVSANNPPKKRPVSGQNNGVSKQPSQETKGAVNKSSKGSTNPKMVELESFMKRMSLVTSRYDKTLKVAVVSVFICLVSVPVNVFLFFSTPPPVYFAVGPDMSITKLVGLNEPYIQDDGLKLWLSQTINKTFSLDFKNYRDQIMEVGKFYDRRAHEGLVVSMRNNNIFSLLDKSKVLSIPVIQKAPVILAKGMHEGVYTWKMELELRIDYESSNGIEASQNLKATVLVERCDTLTNPQGVIIKQLVLR